MREPLGAVVLHYRYWPQVRDTIDALLLAVPPEQIVIVENGSHDGSVEKLRTAYPECRVVEVPGANGGYAKGMNVGIAQWPERDVLCVAHDCVVEPGAVRLLVDHLASDPTLGAVGPLLAFRNRPETVFSVGGTLDAWWRAGHRHSRDLVAEHRGDPPSPVEWLDGSCLLLSRAMLDDVGVFDEGFFLYFEETDLLCRARSRGWRLDVVPEAVASQQPGDGPALVALWTRNRLRFLSRNAPLKALARQICVEASAIRDRERRRGLWAFVARRPPKALAVRR